MGEWCPFAIRYDGPAWKQGYGGLRRRNGKGAVVHSMEGRYVSALGVLESTRESSWTFSLLYGGGLIQHYPLSAVCWHAGGPYPNTRWWGCECEGRAGETLTRMQKDTLVALLLWSAEEEDWPGFTRPLTDADWP